jgi:hypothetical protein
VSDPSSDSSPDAPSGTVSDDAPTEDESSSAEEETVALQLSLPEDQIDQLQAVAQQLGLTPSTVARRAIELICQEVSTVQHDERPPRILIEQYQARIDLLHSVENVEGLASDDEGGTDADDGPADE